MLVALINPLIVMLSFPALTDDPEIEFEAIVVGEFAEVILTLVPALRAVLM